MPGTHRQSGFKHDVCDALDVRTCPACRTGRIYYHIFETEDDARAYMEARPGKRLQYNYRRWDSSFLQCREHIILH